MGFWTKNARSNVFWTLCIVGLFAILSSTLSKNPVLKPFAASLQTPEGFWMGFVASASTIPGILASLPAGSLSDIFGRRKFLLISGAVFASAPFLYLLITAWWQLVLVRFYHGFATAVFVPVAEASVAQLYPAKRAERISLFSSATAVGRGLAPFLGGYVLFATNYAYDQLYLYVGVAGATAFISALLFLAETRSPRDNLRNAKAANHVITGQWKEVSRNRGVLVVSFVQACQYYVYGAVEYFLVGYLKEVAGLNPLLIGLIMGIQIVIVIITKPYLGKISDKIGRRIPIVGGILVSSFPIIAIPFTMYFPFLLLLSAVYAVGFAAVTASTPALVSESVPNNLVGTAMGYLSTIMDVGQTLGPIVTGMIVATTLGYKGAFSALAAITFSSCAIFALLKVPESSR